MRRTSLVSSYSRYGLRYERLQLIRKIPALDQAGEACLRELASLLPRREHRHSLAGMRCFNTYLVHCSVEKVMHQRSNPIHFFFQREMARGEKMELCTGNISFKEFSTLHRKDSIVFAPSD